MPRKQIAAIWKKHGECVLWKYYRLFFFFSLSIPFLTFLKANSLCLFPLTSFSALNGSCMRAHSLLLILQSQCLELFLAPRSGYSTNTCQTKERRNSALNMVFLSFLHLLYLLSFLPLCVCSHFSQPTQVIWSLEIDRSCCSLRREESCPSCPLHVIWPLGSHFLISKCTVWTG